MRLRVTSAMQKQLADLRDRKVGQRRGGVMRVPRILSWDEWEAMAAVQQDKLIADSYEDRRKPVERAATEDDTAARNAAENERIYQESRKAAAEGGLSLIRANEQRVRTLTTR